MPYVSESTYDDISFALHDTAEDAAAHLLEEIGPDYAETFWLADNGRDIVQAEKSCPDFSIRVYPSVEIALGAQMGLDLDALPHVLRAMAATP